MGRKRGDVMAALQTAAPVVTDMKQADELLVLCASLGMRDKNEDTPSVYHMGDECRGTVRSYCPCLCGTLPS